MCPAPCVNRLCLHQSGALNSPICRACQTRENSARDAADPPSSSPPPLLIRLVQAALLLETAMKTHDDLPSMNEPEQPCLLEQDMGRLASALHEDRCQGAEVNCSVLGLYVRLVSQMSRKPLRLLMEQLHPDPAWPDGRNAWPSRCKERRRRPENDV